MPYDKATGKMGPNKAAGSKANSKTAGPGGSFPIGDAKHARLAISGATRSEKAGNISPATEASIKAKARAALGGSKPKPAPKTSPKPSATAMKAYEASAADRAQDKRMGTREGSAADRKADTKGAAKMQQNRASGRGR